MPKTPITYSCVKCTHCETPIYIAMEILKNNGQRKFQGCLDCCGAPICDTCLKNCLISRCPFCKIGCASVLKLKHTCFHHTRFDNGCQNFWKDYYHYCIALQSFRTKVLFTDQFMKWTYIYHIKLNWRNVQDDMMPLYLKFRQWQQINAFVCYMSSKILDDVIEIYRGVFGVKYLLKFNPGNYSKLPLFKKIASRLAISEYGFFLLKKNHFFKKILRRIVARLLYY